MTGYVIQSSKLIGPLQMSETFANDIFKVFRWKGIVVFRYILTEVYFLVSSWQQVGIRSWYQTSDVITWTNYHPVNQWIDTEP